MDMQSHTCAWLKCVLVRLEEAREAGGGRSTKGRSDSERLRGQEVWDIWLGGAWGAGAQR